MDSELAHQYLRYPAYGLYHVISLAQSEAGNYVYDIVPTFLSAFDADQRANVRAALKWAEEAESIDWEKVLPDLPHSDPFKRAHLRTVLKRIDATYGGVVPGAG